MPQRFLKPGITHSEKWNACTWMAQSFYIRLITLVDDYGRFEASPRLLRSLAFPLSEDLRTDQVLALMKELQEQQLAHFYKAGGKDYLQLTGWSERVRAASRYPEPDSKCQQMLADVVTEKLQTVDNQAKAESCEHLTVNVVKCQPPKPPPSPSPKPAPPRVSVIELAVERAKRLESRLCAMFKRPSKTRWVYEEERLLAETSRREDCESEMTELEAFRKLPDSYFPRSLGRLLENWTSTLDRARSHGTQTNGKPHVKSLPEQAIDSIKARLKQIT